MSEHKGSENSKLDSEKSKDIRQTNIIAAKGKCPSRPSQCGTNLCLPLQPSPMS